MGGGGSRHMIIPASLGTFPGYLNSRLLTVLAVAIAMA